MLESLEFGTQVIRYTLIFVSAFFRQRASLGCEMVAMRSQLSFYKDSIRQKRQPRPRFHPAFRLLWVLLSRVWNGWKSAAELMTSIQCRRRSPLRLLLGFEAKNASCNPRDARLAFQADSQRRFSMLVSPKYAIRAVNF